MPVGPVPLLRPSAPSGECARLFIMLRPRHVEQAPGHCRAFGRHRLHHVLAAHRGGAAVERAGAAPAPASVSVSALATRTGMQAAAHSRVRGRTARP
eukprot:6202446-Pleurochrysis_carterae.AAC.2